MKILLLSRFGQDGASSRLRFHQYVPYLRSLGWTISVAPLFSDKYLNKSYSGKPVFFEYIRAFFSRVIKLLTVKKHDLIWLEGEVFPFLPAFAIYYFKMMGVPYVVDYDDVDIAKRVKDQGLKSMFYPKARIIHYGGGDSSKIPRKTIRNLLSSKFKFVLKHYGLVAVFLLLLIEMIRIIRIIILSPIYLIKGRRSRIWWNIHGVFRSFFLVLGNYSILKQKQNLNYEYMVKNKLF